MKKRGFTLVELMGVLIILGVLSAILIPVISNTLKEQKQKQYEQQLQVIQLAAKNLATDNVFILPNNEDERIYVTLEQLKKTGYLDNSIINPKTNKEFSNCTVVEIKKVNNNYEYVIDESTLDLESCDNSVDSVVTISSPSNRYVKDGSSSSYIVIVKSNNEGNLFTSYTLDESKISFGEINDLKYSIVGENGIYKITIIGGTEEGDIILTLQSGSILDETGNDIVGDNIVASNLITVDNTAPECGTWNGQSTTWTNQPRTITMAGVDSVSGVKEGNSFSKTYTSGEITTDNLSYTVEDTVGNTRVCETVANVYIDTVAPTIYDIYNSGDGNWTNGDVTISAKASDSASDVSAIYYSYSSSGELNDDWDLEKTATSVKGSWSVERNDTIYLVAKDNAGNSSVYTSAGDVKIDKTAPTIYDIYNSSNSNWTNGDVTISAKASDSASDVSAIYYSYSSSGELNDDWDLEKTATSVKGSWSVERNDTIYLVAKDNVGNTSVYTSAGAVRIDKTTPTISTSLDCTPRSGYNQCIKFIVNDNSKERLYLDKSHCVDSDVTAENPQQNSCKNGYTAINRLNNYINGTNNYPEDNKSTTWGAYYSTTTNSYTFGDSSPVQLDTSYSTTIQYAARVCDLAGNCSDIKSGTHNNQK